MNKFHKLLMGTTAIVSMFGWNVNVAQAQSIPAYCTGSAIGALLVQSLLKHEFRFLGL
jgi:hypothetical protein